MVSSQNRRKTRRELRRKTADTLDVLGLEETDEDMFLTTPDKEKQTRSQKWKEKKKHQAIWGQPIPLNGGPAQIRKEQEQDPSLEIPRRQCDQPVTPSFRIEGIVYRRWKPARKQEFEQLVLP